MTDRDNGMDPLEQQGPITLNALRRQSAVTSQHNPKVDVDLECGYVDSYMITAQMYRELHDRNAVANRVNRVYPDECWKVMPVIQETDDETKTAFEKAVDNLGKTLQTERSYAADAKLASFWSNIHEGDVKCGIGNFGILFLGFDDGGDLSDPAPGYAKGDDGVTVNAEGSTGLLYVTALDESEVTIGKLDNDERSPRYGMPLSYGIIFNNESVEEATKPTPVNTEVHWSRVIHLTEGGVPRCKKVWNNLIDLKKIYGGSAEGFWSGAIPTLTFTAHPQFANGKMDQDDLKEQLNKYYQYVQRYLASNGGRWDIIAPEVVNPLQHIEAQMEAICVAIGCPKRIFMGVEQGELASTGERDTWNERLVSRQELFITPKVIHPLIDRLITVGVLPEPPEGYYVTWPDMMMQTAKAKANLSSIQMDTIVKYLSSDAQELISPVDFLSMFMHLKRDRAQEVYDAAGGDLSRIVEGSVQLPAFDDEDAKNQVRVTQQEGQNHDES